VLIQTETVLSLIKDAETGQRGYLLTGSEEYLKPYQAALAEISGDLDKLSQLVASNPQDRERVAKIRSLITAKLSELQRTIQLRRSQGYESALSVVRTDQGQHLMEQIRVIGDGIQSEMLALLTQRAAYQERTGNWVAWLTFASVAIQILLVTGIILKLNREVQTLRQAKVDLLQNEERYRSLVTATSQVIWIANTTGELLSFTPAWQDITGQSEQDAKGWGWLEVVHPDDRSNARDQWQKAVNDQTFYQAEYRLGTTEKNYREFLVRGVPVLQDDGTVREWVGNYVDITERRQAETALWESEERYRVLAEVMPQAVWMAEPDGYITYCNQHWCNYTGLAMGQIVGDGWVSTVHPEDRERVMKAWKSATVRDDDYEIEVRFQQASDGIYRWHLVRGLPLRDTNGQTVKWLGVAMDIHSRKQAEESLLEINDELEVKIQGRTSELRQLNEKLVRSNQELEQFAYVASHDLQETLRTVASYTQLLEKKYREQLDEKADKYIGYVVDGATRMQQLINDLLSYSRVGRQELNLKQVNCNDIIEQIKTSLRAAIAENHAIITTDELPTVVADAVQLTQLLQNLVSNAIKYRGDAAPEIHITATQHPEEWVFLIRDNGTGIEPQYAERIFVIFQRLHTRRKYTGTGIGLAICKKIVEMHNGSIWVESQPGAGSTFYFTLPHSINNQLATLLGTPT
jgi:PAS domain S-box-containing protein